MPSYEGLLVLKKFAKPELANVIKRAATHIYDSKGILFGIENLGTRQFPYAISTHQGRRYWEGSYVLMKFDSSVAAVFEIGDEFKRDLDILKYGFVRLREPEKIECSLDEELKPPAYRESVQKMIEEGRKRPYFKFDPRTGLDYNPFRT